MWLWCILGVCGVWFLEFILLNLWLMLLFLKNSLVLSFQICLLYSFPFGTSITCTLDCFYCPWCCVLVVFVLFCFLFPFCFRLSNFFSLIFKLFESFLTCVLSKMNLLKNFHIWYHAFYFWHFHFFIFFSYFHISWNSLSIHVVHLFHYIL